MSQDTIVRLPFSKSIGPHKKKRATIIQDLVQLIRDTVYSDFSSKMGIMMHTQVSFSAATVREIDFANSINQATLSKKSREQLIHGLLQHCYLFFDQAQSVAINIVRENNLECRKITYFQNRRLNTFYYCIPVIQGTLFHSSYEQKFRQLADNSATQTCMMHCTYLLAQALIDGHNQGVATTRHNRNIIGLKHETFVLNLLAEVDSDCIELHKLATSRAIQSLCLSFFLKSTNVQPLQNPTQNGIFNSNRIWTTQFQGKLMPKKITSSNEKTETVNPENQEGSKFLTFVSDLVTAILSKPTVPLYPCFWPLTPHK